MFNKAVVQAIQRKEWPALVPFRKQSNTTANCGGTKCNL